MRHILVVEDDAVNALLFRMILEKRGGFQVTVTESPDEILFWWYFTFVQSPAAQTPAVPVCCVHGSIVMRL